jgi:hypothetical protein
MTIVRNSDLNANFPIAMDLILAHANPVESRRAADEEFIEERYMMKAAR